MENRYNGRISVCDWEHEGDYTYPCDLLCSVPGTDIDSYENHGDGNTAYIYFKCEEQSIIPLLKIDEFDSLFIDYPYRNLLHEDSISKGLILLERQGDFTPTELIDKLESPLSWRFDITFEQFFRRFSDNDSLSQHLATLHMQPTHLHIGTNQLAFYGTGILSELFDIIISVKDEHLYYFFGKEMYYIDELIYKNKLQTAIKENFTDVILRPSGNYREKDTLTTRTIENSIRRKKEVDSLSEVLEYFYDQMKSLNDTELRSDETTTTQLVLYSDAPEGISFFDAELPYIVKKIVADKTIMTLTDKDGKKHKFRPGKITLSKESIIHWGESINIEHDIYMQILNALELAYLSF